MDKTNSVPSGISYVFEGAKLLLKPGRRRFVLVPLLANFMVFIVLTTLLFQSFSDINLWFENLLSVWSWLAFIAGILATLLSLFVFFTVMLIYGISFTLITNFIAAPFYGLLAENIEAEMTGSKPPPESFAKMLPRVFLRELVKLGYFLSRGAVIFIGLLILSFIPLLNLLVPVIAFLWGAWVITLQYVDYPADNHQLPFRDLRHRLKQQRYSSIGHGGTVVLGSMIPLVNIFVMPIAVASGTLFWVKELHDLKEGSATENTPIKIVN